jgi:putative ABC transport system permease protein
MPAPLNKNRAMFWRILRRLLFAHRGRLFVILLALGAGASITAALLNLQVDAKRRLTTEFRVLGANVVVAPRATDRGTERETLNEVVIEQIPVLVSQRRIPVVAFLYLIADASSFHSGKPVPAVVAGNVGYGVIDIMPGAAAAISSSISRVEPNCILGVKVATALKAGLSDRLVLKVGDREETCNVAIIIAHGGTEDNQILINLDVAQRLAALPGKISLIQLSVPGTPQEIQTYISGLQKKLPEADVRPIRQFTEGEARIYNRISGVLTATAMVVLVLTGLCVMAAMTNVAMERRNDVGLMKAIGGTSRRVLRLFLVEAALLGLAGGLLGAAAGIGLSMWLGKAVFGLAARPRLIVYPVAVTLTILVSIAGAFPLRRLVSIRPASVFRGEA